MGRKVTLAEIVYKPILLVLLLLVGYLLGSSYIASMTPGSDCSFVGLFVALGIIFAVIAAGILLNLFSVSLYLRTGKRIFSLFSAVGDLVSTVVFALIGTVLLSDKDPLGMKIMFVLIAVGSAACFVINVARLFKKG